MFTYKKVEALFAQLYHAPPEAVGSLRGRLKNLKRLGVPIGSHTGKGKRVNYTTEQVWQWAFCLELMECGLDPASIVLIVKAQWPVIRREFNRAAKATKDEPDLFLVLMLLSLMSGPWSISIYGAIGEPRVGVQLPWVGAVTLDSLSNHLRLRAAEPNALNRWLAFNLSRVVRRIDEASKETTA